MIARGAVLDVHAERLLDDVALAAELGLQLVRLDVPWALAQPRAGGFDGDVFEHVHGVGPARPRLGLEPWFRLLQPAVPLWFDDEGGFTDDRTAATFWPRWVELVAERLGDVAAGWVPFEAPFAMCNRLMPDDPRRHGEVVHHVVVAWRDAWRILRGPLPVATSLDVAVERPTDESPQAREEAAPTRPAALGPVAAGLHRRRGAHPRPRRPSRSTTCRARATCSGWPLRSDVETCLYRAAEHGLGSPAGAHLPPARRHRRRAARSRSKRCGREVHQAAQQLDIAIGHHHPVRRHAGHARHRHQGS